MRQLVRVAVAAAALLAVLGRPAPAAAAHAAYRVKVDTATVNYLALLGLPDLGLFGPDQTAHLESPKLTALGFTGVNPWDRTRAAKLADGTWRYQYEDVTTATGIPAANLKGVRSWIDAPYHRLPLLDANTRHIGCAVDHQGSYTAQVLEMAATWKDTTSGPPCTRPPATRPSPPPSTAARSTRPRSAAPARRPAPPSRSATWPPSRPTGTTP